MKQQIKSFNVGVLATALLLSPIYASAAIDCSAPGLSGCSANSSIGVVSPFPNFVFDDTNSAAADDWALIGLESTFRIEAENGAVIPFRIDTGSAQDSIHITSQGVGVRTATPATELHVVGDARIDNGTSSWDLSVSATGAFGLIGSNVAIPFSIEDGAPNFSLYVAGNDIGAAAPGNIGIGTFLPTEAVTVERSGSAARFMLTSLTNTGNQAAQFVQRRARGSSGALAALGNGDNLGLFSFRGHNGTSFSGSRATITAQTAQAWSTSAQGTRLLFGTTENGTTAPRVRMEITHDGRVLINGSQLNVPDYVFEPDYDLRSLSDLRKFVQTEKHLPGVPNAQEINSGGLDVTGLQMSLLEKVEELTLYVLEQQDTIESLQAGEKERFNELEKQNAKLEARLAELEKQI